MRYVLLVVALLLARTVSATHCATYTSQPTYSYVPAYVVAYVPAYTYQAGAAAPVWRWDDYGRPFTVDAYNNFTFRKSPVYTHSQGQKYYYNDQGELVWGDGKVKQVKQTAATGPKLEPKLAAKKPAPTKEDPDKPRYMGSAKYDFKKKTWQVTGDDGEWRDATQKEVESFGFGSKGPPLNGKRPPYDPPSAEY